jgi:general secretion pathway protein E
MQTAADTVADHRLTLTEVLDGLVADGFVSRADADKLIAERRMHRGEHHPLVIVADQKWKSLAPPGKVMHLEWLAEWLADKTGLGYYHIDPLKINFSAVTDVMSNAYATRFKILPVEVNTREVTIATSEPYVKAWEKELAQMLRLEIRRVVANPLDIARYQVEFYNLARSVKARRTRETSAAASATSSSWSRWARRTARSTRTTSMWSMSSTGCGSTRSTSAQATFTWSRAAILASCASGSTACCIRSIRSPCR